MMMSDGETALTAGGPVQKIGAYMGLAGATSTPDGGQTVRQMVPV